MILRAEALDTIDRRAIADGNEIVLDVGCVVAQVCPRLAAGVWGELVVDLGDIFRRVEVCDLEAKGRMVSQYFTL